VLAVVLIDHNTQPGSPVAASSKQLPAAKTGAGTGSNRSHGTTTAATSSSSLAGHKGNGRVSTRAAGNATSSGGGSGAGPAAAGSSINPASAASPAVNLPVPAHFGPLLRRTWARANPGGAGIKTSDIQSTAVGSVFYADQPAVHTYWAITQFVPSALAESRSGTPAGAALLAEFRGTAVFEKVAAHHWTYVGSFNAGACPGYLPGPVLTAWGLCTVGS
jgi:hypothetical protein